MTEKALIKSALMHEMPDLQNFQPKMIKRSGKTKKALLIAAIIILCFVLCAFAVVRIVRLFSASGDKIDMGFEGAEVAGTELLLYVNYNSYGQDFEIGRDITVATDPNFENVLRPRSCTPNGSLYTYKYDIDEAVDTVYVAPPVLYVPKTIEPYCVPLYSDEDGEWFSISDVRTTKAGAGMYAVTVEIEPFDNTLPRFPKLDIGDGTVGITARSTSHNFNADFMFDYSVFSFTVYAEDEERLNEMLKTASIVVEDALVIVEAKDVLFSTNITKLDVELTDYVAPPPDENPSHENGASVTDDIEYTMSAGDFYAGDMYDGFSDVLERILAATDVYLGGDILGSGYGRALIRANDAEKAELLEIISRIDGTQFEETEGAGGGTGRLFFEDGGGMQSVLFGVGEDGCWGASVDLYDSIAMSSYLFAGVLDLGDYTEPSIKTYMAEAESFDLAGINGWIQAVRLDNTDRDYCALVRNLDAGDAYYVNKLATAALLSLLEKTPGLEGEYEGTEDYSFNQEVTVGGNTYLVDTNSGIYSLGDTLYRITAETPLRRLQMYLGIAG
jgi:hypothetical protein